MTTFPLFFPQFKEKKFLSRHLTANLRQVKQYDNAYLSPFVHVTLIPQNHFLYVLRGVFFNVSNPVLDVVERFLVGNVVDKHDAHGAAVVGRRDGTETLLAGCVPYL